jgi:hypothetical protein
MKIRFHQKFKQAASTLVTVLVICAILSMSISYYLSLVEQQNVLSTRSQAWNMAMTITEAGLEEGLQQLNSNAGSLTTDGWTFDGSLYWRSNTMPDGSTYSVNINFSSPSSPTIIARSWVRTASQGSLFGYVNGGTTAASSVNKVVTRAVRVRASRSNLYLNALVARHTIDLNGNGIMTDSYDSGDPSKSTAGHYDSTKYSGDMGDVASNDGIVNALSVGNANIYGHAHVGAGGTDSIGQNGAIGEHSWQAGNKGTEAGWFAADANFTFPDTSFPYSSGSSGVLSTAPAGDIVTTTYSTNSAATTSTTYPNPPPASGVITNTTYATVTPWSAVPSPAPAGTSTNGPFSTNSVAWLPGATFTNTAVWKTYPAYPAAGTYLGSVSTNFNGNGTIKEYVYNHITGYAFPSYYTYTYPVSTYGYNLDTITATYTTNHYDHILASGSSYYMNTLTGTTYVAGMDVRLVVADGIDLTQPFVIPASSAIEVWTGGTTVTLSGNDGANSSGIASSFILNCASTVTDFTLSGNAIFTGILIAPTVNVHLNGSGNSNVDVNGSMMVNSATLNGHFSFHYDEALRRSDKQGRYLVTTWDEIP